MTKKTEKAEIKKIVLDLGGVEVGLTLEQAKNLYEILHEMFGAKSTYVHPTYWPIYYPDPATSYPSWSYTEDTWHSSSCNSFVIKANYNSETETVTFKV